MKKSDEGEKKKEEKKPDEKETKLKKEVTVESLKRKVTQRLDKHASLSKIKEAEARRNKASLSKYKSALP